MSIVFGDQISIFSGGSFKTEVAASGSCDISTTPTGFSLYNPNVRYGGVLVATIDNGASYSLGDSIVVFHGTTPIESFDASIGSGNVCGLTNDIEYVLYCKAIQSDKKVSLSSNINSATPTSSSDTTPPSTPIGISIESAPSAPNITGIN